jgi:hypothetical protein
VDFPLRSKPNTVRARPNILDDYTSQPLPVPSPQLLAVPKLTCSLPFYLRFFGVKIVKCVFLSKDIQKKIGIYFTGFSNPKSKKMAYVRLAEKLFADLSPWRQ